MPSVNDQFGQMVAGVTDLYGRLQEAEADRTRTAEICQAAAVRVGLTERAWGRPVPEVLAEEIERLREQLAGREEALEEMRVWAVGFRREMGAEVGAKDAALHLARRELASLDGVRMADGSIYRCEPLVGVLRLAISGKVESGAEDESDDLRRRLATSESEAAAMRAALHNALRMHAMDRSCMCPECNGIRAALATDAGKTTAEILAAADEYERVWPKGPAAMLRQAHSRLLLAVAAHRKERGDARE